MFDLLLNANSFWGGLLVVILGAIYTVIKPYLTQWLAEKKLEQLYDVFEKGCIGVYKTYTEARIKANEDGKLTEEEQEEARKLCLDFVIDWYKSAGQDLLKEYSEKVLRIILENALIGAKLDGCIDCGENQEDE